MTKVLLQPWQLLLSILVGMANEKQQHVIEYHHQTERYHHRLGNQLLEPTDDIAHSVGKLKQSERLGGMLRYYHRNAA